MPSPNQQKEIYTAKQRYRLRQFERFLSNISEPSIGALAARHGYDGEEHSYGWQQYGVAAGMDRPFEHYLSEAERSVLLGAGSSTIERYRELDDFENTWFPRTRNAIRRFVAPDQVQIFEEAFFDDLSQQPEGPQVVASVELFLLRLAAMRNNDTPGAKKAYAGLVKKGLSDELIQRVGELVKAAKTEAAPAAAPRVSEADIAEANQRQLDAFAKLNLWYIDWADTLRTELSYRQLVRLGLTAARGRRKRVIIEDDDDEGGDAGDGERSDDPPQGSTR